MNTFEDFYSRIGFEKYPFSTFTTEKEKDVFSQIFVKPSNYDTILNNYLQGNSIILSGDRGTGKTAIIKNFQHKIKEKDSIIISIEDFTDLDTNFDSKSFYKFLIKKFASQLISNLASFPNRVRLLNSDDKLLLSYLIKHVVPQISKKAIKDKIEKIQLPWYKRLYKIGERFFRGAANYTVTVGSHILDDYISKHLTGIPPLPDTTNIKDYFPEIPINFDDEFENQEHNFDFLTTIVNISKKLKFDKNIIIFDKIDEDQRFDNDAELISEFIVKILTDNRLLANEDIQFIFSLWVTPYNFIKSRIRTQKHYCPVLNWSKQDLETALNQRLKVYSSGKIIDYRSLFSDEVTSEEIDNIFSIANSNPRDLWHIFDKLLNKQFQLKKSISKIQNKTIPKALSDFVISFNYFEYYPRKANARANSMDIYSYTNYLLKLKSEYFTKPQLDSQTGTGGSTNNYVVGMERIGLITQHSQESGAVVYKIKDPKIVFALKNNLEIRKR